MEAASYLTLVESDLCRFKVTGEKEVCGQRKRTRRRRRRKREKQWKEDRKVSFRDSQIAWRRLNSAS